MFFVATGDQILPGKFAYQIARCQTYQRSNCCDGFVSHNLPQEELWRFSKNLSLWPAGRRDHITSILPLKTLIHLIPPKGPKDPDLKLSHQCEDHGAMGSIFVDGRSDTFSVGWNIRWISGGLLDSMWVQSNRKSISFPLPETNIFAPENGWLGDGPFILGNPIFRLGY